MKPLQMPEAVSNICLPVPSSSQKGSSWLLVLARLHPVPGSSGRAAKAGLRAFRNSSKEQLLCQTPGCVWSGWLVSAIC